MREKIIEELNAVLVALNSIYVSGKNNLANLSGSISLLEKIHDEVLALEEGEKSTPIAEVVLNK